MCGEPDSGYVYVIYIYICLCALLVDMYKQECSFASDINLAKNCFTCFTKIIKLKSKLNRIKLNRICASHLRLRRYCTCNNIALEQYKHK